MRILNLFNNKFTLPKLDESSAIKWKKDNRKKQLETCKKNIVNFENRYSNASEEITKLIQELKSIYNSLYEYYNSKKSFNDLNLKLDVKQINEKRYNLLALTSNRQIDLYILNKYEKIFMEALRVYENNQESILIKVEFYNKFKSPYRFTEEDKIKIKKLKRFTIREEIPLIIQIKEMYNILEKFNEKDLNSKTKENIYNLKIICKPFVSKTFSGLSYDEVLKNQIKSLEETNFKDFIKYLDFEYDLDETLHYRFPLSKNLGTYKEKNKLIIKIPKVSTLGKAAAMILMFLSLNGKAYAENFINRNKEDINHVFIDDKLENNKLFEHYLNKLNNSKFESQNYRGLSEEKINYYKDKFYLEKKQNLDFYNYLLANNQELLLNLINQYESYKKLTRESIAQREDIHFNKESFYLYFSLFSKENEDVILKSLNNQEKLNQIMLKMGKDHSLIVLTYSHETPSVLASISLSEKKINILYEISKLKTDNVLFDYGLFLLELVYSQKKDYDILINHLDFLLSKNYFKNNKIEINLNSFHESIINDKHLTKRLITLLDKVENLNLGNIDNLKFNLLLFLANSENFINDFNYFIDKFEIKIQSEEFNGILNNFRSMSRFLQFNNQKINYDSNAFNRNLRILNNKGYKIKNATDLFNLMFYSINMNKDMIRLTSRYNITNFSRFNNDCLQRLINDMNSNRTLIHRIINRNKTNKEAVLLFSKADYNAVFLTHKKEINSVPENYNITLYEVGNDTDFINAIKNHNDIDLLIIGGHGNQKLVAFGYAPHNDLIVISEEEKEKLLELNENQYLDFSDIQEIKEMISRLKKGGKIIFHSCSVGKGEDDEDNLVNFISSFCDEITVFGANNPIQRTEIRYDKNGKVIDVKYESNLHQVQTYRK